MIGNTEQDIAIHWSLAPPLHLVAVETGTNNRSSMVETRDGSYVLKLYENQPAADRLAFEHALLGSLSTSTLPFAVPAPIATRSGATSARIDNDRASLFHLIPGHAPGLGSVSAAYQCGEALAILDKALQAMMFSPAIRVPETFGDLSTVHPLILHPIESMYQLLGHDALTDGITIVMAAMQERWRGVTSGWPTQIIHSDFYPTNVLMDSGRVTGILDFEFAGSGYRAMDFAIGLVAFGVRNWEDDRPWLVLESFARGYLGRTPLADAELAATPMLVLMRELTSFVHWLGRMQLGSTTSMTTPSDIWNRARKVLALERWLRRNESQLIHRLSTINRDRS